MPIISAMVGSSQTSKAVNAATAGIDNARAAIDAGSTGAQTGMTNTTDAANNVLDYVNQQQQNTLNPYLQTGANGLDSLNKALAPGGALTTQFAFDPKTVADNPDYQFQLQQGLQATQRAAAANGTLQSGGTLKALDQFSQGLASTSMQQYYNQALSTFNTNRQNAYQSLALPISIGQTATPQSLSAWQNFGNTSTSNDINAQRFNSTAQIDQAAKDANLAQDKGNVKATGSVQQGKIWSSFANNVGNDASKALAGLG